jgi:hypothetical protein
MPSRRIDKRQQFVVGLSIRRSNSYLIEMRTVLLYVLMGFLGAGCVPVFKLDKLEDRSCTEDFIPWSGGLTRHVDEGNGTGEFDYINPDTLIDQTAGYYDLSTGEFFWWDEYLDAGHRERGHYSGVGTLWRNGDLDLDYEREFYYSDDTKEVWAVRQERFGCEENFRYASVDNPEDLEFVSGSYGSGVYEYTHEWIFGAVVAVATGSQKADQSYVEDLEVIDGPILLVHQETGDGQGNVSRIYSYDDGFTKVEGTWDQGVEGTVSMDYFSKSPGSKRQYWVYHYDAMGNGEGSWSQDDVSCDLVFEQGECKRRACSDDSNGKCVVPVEAPQF